MSLNRSVDQTTEAKFLTQLEKDIQEFQSIKSKQIEQNGLRLLSSLESPYISLSPNDDYGHIQYAKYYQKEKKNLQFIQRIQEKIKRADNEKIAEVKEALHHSNYEIVELGFDKTCSPFNYPNMMHETAPFAAFGRYSIMTNPNDYVVRATGDSFGDRNQRFSSVLASGKALPHQQFIDKQQYTKSIEQRIFDHRNKEEIGQAG